MARKRKAARRVSGVEQLVVPQVHEEGGHEGGLHRRDEEGDDDVGGAEVVIGDLDGEERQENERAEDAEVETRARDVNVNLSVVVLDRVRVVGRHDHSGLPTR